MQPQEPSLRPRKHGKKPKSKGKAKADVSKAGHMPSQGPAIVPQPTDGDDQTGFTFSMRPPTKSIVQQEKERLKAGVSTMQPTPGPSKARSAKVGDRHPTPGPSKISEDWQKNTLEPDGQAALKQMTEHVGVEALHNAYKEVPIVPLEFHHAQNKAAEPNHHRRGLPLKSAMKQKAPPSSDPTVHKLHADSNGRSKDRGSNIPIERLMAPNKTIQQVVRQGKRSADASKNLDAASGQASDQLVSKPERQRLEVKRIKMTPPDQLNRAQSSPTKCDIEDEPATPLMKIQKDDRAYVSPAKRISKKQKKGSGPTVGNSEGTSPSSDFRPLELAW
ncbi:hypothetical protein JVT61DRAFT_9117 [Boletus reticuloceps]|uniref:Uncharacterized protein n=1 Tax=Boletus reticuloceps TaxID=495285 RepID=A0A8I3A6S0_9AGAM|nr:hypothetical protein JVT61DRAFT_9117 [Boletus reticuloceps]